jgi:S-formylglutathione hydrolase FrmB
LHRRLQARGVPHEFALKPGDHGYEYVRSVLPSSLEFLAKRLAAK